MKPVLRAMWREPHIRSLRDFPRVLLYSVGLAFIVAPPVAFAQGNQSLLQIWAEIACVTLGGLLLRLWWEIVR